MEKKHVKAIVNLVLALVVLLLVIFLLPKFLVYFMPFVIGWVIACIAGPLVKFFEEKLKIRRKAGTAFVIMAVIAGVILLAYLLIAKLIQELIGLTLSLPQLWQSLETDMRAIGQNWAVFYTRLPADMQNGIVAIGTGAEQAISNFVSNIGTPTVAAVGNFAKNVPSVIIGIIMSVLSAYFFISEKEYVQSCAKKYIPRTIREKWNVIFGSMKTAVGGYFKAQLKIECWIYILLLAGLMFLKINYAFLIAFGIAILDFLPFFGTGTVMVPWAIVKFLSGDYQMMLGLLIIWGVGQLVRQIIQPKIVGDSMGVAPIPTLILLFLGYKIAGVIGMIVAVPVGIIVVNMNQAGAFDTVKQSIGILVDSVNRFRKFTEDEVKKTDEKL